MKTQKITPVSSVATKAVVAVAFLYAPAAAILAAVSQVS